MINCYDLLDAEIPMSMKALRKVLMKRGWKAEKLSLVGLNDWILTRPDGRILKIAATTPPTTTVYALHLADNKMMSYELLKEIGVPQPETVVARKAEDVQKLLEKYEEIVIKPVDGAHGNGVTTGIKDLGEVDSAIERAKSASQQLRVAIAQPQLQSDEPELRIICIDYKFVLAAARISAVVTGDGVHTVGELIEIENNTIRTEAYASDLAFIEKESAWRYLGEKVNQVPEAEEKVRVSSICNLGKGGTVEDYSEIITDELKEMAEKIARAAELPVVGVDLFGGKVIEINAAPSLYWPFTNSSQSMKAIEAYVDYLERI